MRFRADSRGAAVVCTCLLLLSVGGAAQSPQLPPPPASLPAPPEPQAIADAIERVRTDPSMATQRTMRILRWRSTPSSTTSRPTLPAWLRWFQGLFRWIALSARTVVWVVGGLLIAWLAFHAVRLVRGHAGGLTGMRLPAPTHVGDLDIRPESLPDDIGQAARTLWDRGDRRAALSLLYRGLLSRLVHAHRVPIRDSTTEGGCLTLAASHLPADRHEYVSRVVGVWQQFVYAGKDAETPIVHLLCAGFSPALDAPPEAASKS